nr:hypothetical protein [Tanacetum cinerariifolium]
RNKADLEEQSLDDLFNNLKIYEAKVKGSSTSSQNTQMISFVSLNNTNSTNESFNVVHSVSAASSKATVSTLPIVDSLTDAVIYSFFASQSNTPQLDKEDLKQIDPDDLEEIDLKWQMAMLTMRAKRFLKRTGRNLGVNGTDTIGFDMSKVECYNYHRRGHFARECRSPRDNRNKEATRRPVPTEESQFDVLSYKTGLEDNALVELRKKFENAKKAEKERDDLKLTLEKFQTSSKNLSRLLKSQVSDNTGLGFDSQVFNSQVFDCEELHSHESDNNVPKNPVNDRYKTGEGYHGVPPPYTGTFMPPKPDLVFNDAPTASESVANVFNVKSITNKPSKDMSKTLRTDSPIVKDWISDSEDETEIESVPKQKEPSFVPNSEHVKTPRESVKKVEHPKQAKNLRINNQSLKVIRKTGIRKPVLNVVPTAVLTRSRLMSLNDVRPVPTTVPQLTVKSPRPVKHVVDKAHSPIKRPINHKPAINNRNFNKKVTTDKVNKVNVVQGNKDFKEINGGYVAFGRNPKCGKISGKDTECVVLSSDYKLPDENHVFFRVPRENMYNVGLKNVVPSGDLTCLFAKATLDVSNL